MRISYQGKDCETDSETLGELLAEKGVDANHAVVEFNGEIMPPGTGLDRALSEGDRLDAFMIVGGG